MWGRWDSPCQVERGLHSRLGWDPEFRAFPPTAAWPRGRHPWPPFSDLNVQPARRPPTRPSRPGPQQASAERACKWRWPRPRASGCQGSPPPDQPQNDGPMSQSRCFPFYSCSKRRGGGSVQTGDARVAGSARSRCPWAGEDVALEKIKIKIIFSWLELFVS